MRARITLAGLVLVALAPGRAHADERADARRHFRAGMALIARARFADGIVELEAAYAILPNPIVLYNVARAYYDAGDLEHSVESLRRYLEHDVADRAEVERVVARLEVRMRNEQAAAAGATSVAPVTTAPSEPAVPSATPENATGETPPAAPTPAITTAVPRVTPRPTEAAVGLTHGSSPDEQYEERVVTASRAEQSTLEAPNAVGVITAQDIRLSGMTTVPELLRRLVGMDVMELDSGDVQVSARGFNQRLNNRMLVLIDGRSVYLDFLGTTLWPTIFPAVEEIERIEVIRGPGSALYGSDAFTGVVNIITRAPGERRTMVSAGVGSGGSLAQGSGWMRGAFVTSGLQGGLAYRASLQYEQRPTYERNVSDTDLTYRNTAPRPDVGFASPRFSLDVQHRFSPTVVLRAGMGGMVGGDLQFTAPGLLRRFWAQATFLQPFVQLEAGGFTGRVFWNRFSALASPVLQPIGAETGTSSVEQDAIDADLQYALHFRAPHVEDTLQLGIADRVKRISWDFLDRDHTLDFFSAYAQDTLRLYERIALIGSVRMDVHPVLPAPVFSPRGAVVFRPTPRRSLRLSAGTAFRTPTLLELYLDTSIALPSAPGLGVAAQGSEVFQNGAFRLRPESALAFDVGWQDQTLDRFQYELDAFLTRGTDLIRLGDVMLSPLGAPTGAGDRVVVGTQTYVNDPGATYVYGAEAAVRVSPVDGLDLTANYTLALTSYSGPTAYAGGAGLPADQRTPVHKLNAGVQVRTRFGLDLEAFAHFVSSQVWLEPVFDATQGARNAAFVVPDYVVLTARVGYRLFHDRLDLGVRGSDIVDLDPANGHFEHPFGARLGARVMASASYRF